MTDVTSNAAVSATVTIPSTSITIPGHTVPAQNITFTVPAITIPAYTANLTSYTVPVAGNTVIDVTVLANLVAAILANSAPVVNTAPAAPVPSITSFTPTSGSIGSTITVTGANLNNVVSATVAGISAVVANANNTLVSLIVPSATANDTGYITLTSSNTTLTTTQQFEIVVPVVVTPPANTSPIAAPSNFTMTTQGANSFSFTWTPVSGASKYNIYRNGTLIGSSTTTTYTDNSATNATVSSFAAPATIYKYAITSVDGSGNEGPQNGNLTYWAYHLGKFLWAGDYSSTTQNYADTTGKPVSNTADISVSYAGTYGYFQPFSGAPSSPEWAAEIGSFNTMLIDIKPAIGQKALKLNIISRLPQGDVYNNAQVDLSSGNFGAWTPGSWCHFQVPFAALGIGTGTLIGSANGTTLNVTSYQGVYVQATDWISAPGITAAPVAINAAASATNGAGSYTLSAAVNAPANTTFNTQRTNMYKFSLVDSSGIAGLTYYVDNVGFTEL
jgi:hypothetical protein